MRLAYFMLCIGLISITLQIGCGSASVTPASKLEKLIGRFWIYHLSMNKLL